MIEISRKSGKKSEKIMQRETRLKKIIQTNIKSNDVKKNCNWQQRFFNLLLFKTSPKLSRLIHFR